MARLVSVISILIALISMIFVSNNAPTRAEGNTLYDYTVCLTTQHLERQFKFKGSQLENKIDRLDVDVYDRDNEQNAAPYESLWYSQGRPLGMELFNKLQVEKGHGVCLKVKHKSSGSDDEIKAAANAIMRLWVDTRLNQSAVIIVKVPGDSYYLFIEYLRNHGMTNAPEVENGLEVNAPMTLLVQSESSGQSQRLAYE